MSGRQFRKTFEHGLFDYKKLSRQDQEGQGFKSSVSHQLHNNWKSPFSYISYEVVRACSIMHESRHNDEYFLHKNQENYTLFNAQNLTYYLWLITYTTLILCLTEHSRISPNEINEEVHSMSVYRIQWMFLVPAKQLIFVRPRPIYGS